MFFGYQVGGSLSYQHPTYVERKADDEIYQALIKGDYCYVLNSRQMGKSSLRVQTMRRLQNEGFKCASLDMTKIGTSIEQHKWYGGIISELIRGFGLNNIIDFDSYWQNGNISEVQRLSVFIEDVILTQFKEQNIVIFIDEIDSVIKVPFKDDFFALIRAFWNQRSDNSEYNRLRFCLLGVASPSDLMQDKQRTPFNIGTYIHLTGFTFDEAKKSGLISGLEFEPENTLKQVLDYTGGQPF
ncbi:MAG TPA: AAA-like domain-containing protein, partial [Allocoleopsis sp.]